MLDQLLASGVLSPRLAACLLMVDFTNPVFSPRRAALMAYVPESASIHSTGGLPAFVTAVEAAASRSGMDSAEAEFLANWQVPESAWRRTFGTRIEAFFEAVRPRLNTADAFAPLFELAESRRREFRKRPLAEFRLTTPVTTIPEAAPLLEWTPSGTVQAKT